MSLWLYDPLREMSGIAGNGRHRQMNAWNPLREMAELERSLDHFFDDSTQQLRLRDHAGQVINDKNGFKYRLDVRGFKDNEIKVDLEGEDIVIQAEHKEENDHESVQRSFCRRLTIPKDVKKESIKCDLDENGRLVIFAPKLAIEGSAEKRSIPIEFKKNNDGAASVENK
uniref:SHSP domain-containing protein n=1 Tax=Panagrolaimus davidi TaxID=227884 RepID=A0A914QF55_9BILA